MANVVYSFFFFSFTFASFFLTMENRGKCGLGGRPVGNDAERYYGADLRNENDWMHGKGMMVQCWYFGGVREADGHRPFALHWPRACDAFRANLFKSKLIIDSPILFIRHSLPPAIEQFLFHCGICYTFIFRSYFTSFFYQIHLFVNCFFPLRYFLWVFRLLAVDVEPQSTDWNGESECWAVGGTII